jgi:hypothetical protein
LKRLQTINRRNIPIGKILNSIKTNFIHVSGYNKKSDRRRIAESNYFGLNPADINKWVEEAKFKSL